MYLHSNTQKLCQRGGASLEVKPKSPGHAGAHPSDTTAQVRKPQPQGRPPDIGHHQSSRALSSNNCSPQNMRWSLMYLGLLRRPQEFTYCHNQSSSDMKLVPRQPNLGGSGTTSRGRQCRQVSHCKPLRIFPSLLHSPNFQHFVS